MARTKKWSVVLMALLAAVFVFALLPTQALAKTGWYEEKYDDGWSDWFYYDKNGKQVKGWKQIGGKWYYFDSQYGYMYSNGSWLVDKKNYVFSKSGALVDKAGWQKFTYTYDSETWTNWFYTNSSGVAATGWKKISGTWYYFWPDYGGMAHDGWIVDGGKYYAFGKNGAMLTNAWYQASVYDEASDGYAIGWLYFGSNGAAVKGWQKSGGSWYYMDAAKGAVPFMVSNTFKKIGGKTYYFNKNGAMATGWKKIGSAYYYFNSDGTMVTKKWVGNYYLKEDGTMAVDEWIGKYHVNKNGKWDQTKK